MDSKLDFLKTGKMIPRKVHLFMESPDKLQNLLNFMAVTPDKLHQNSMNSMKIPLGLQVDSRKTPSGV